MQTIDATRLKHWSVQEYRRMSELGILNPDERTELISTPTGYSTHLNISQTHSIALLSFPDRLLWLTDIFIP